MVKIVLLFLVVLAVLGMFGRLRLGPGKQTRRGVGKCPSCGRYRIGPGPCPCQKTPSKGIGHD
ncbi:MAG: hypothetical protein KGN33_12855 [Paracoccaceae bacterium]|nr:hypothetical protein [Paracoccaceae bacterium]